MHFSFDPAFQQGIIAAFLEKDLKDGVECLKEEYFDDEITGEIAESVRDFFIKVGEAPAKESLLHEIKEAGLAPGRKLTEYIELLDSIYAQIGTNGAYYRAKALEFSNSRTLATSIREAYGLLQQGDREACIGELEKRIRSNGSHPDHQAYDYFGEIDARARRYFEQNRGLSSEGRISTGFSLLDERIQGGLGSGETGVIIAPPKHGKTTALISFAAQALLGKREVLYVTLELSQKVISSKFDSYFFAESMEEIKRKPKSFRDKLMGVRDELRGANLHIAEFPTKGLSLYKLQGLIEKNRPEIVFLDYAALLSSKGGKSERRHELTDIHEGLRGVAGACKLPIWTAHQANRLSLGVRQIGMEHIAEDFNIVAIADICLSINQSLQEQISKTVRFYILGNRLGASGDVIEANANWEISRLSPV